MKADFPFSSLVSFRIVHIPMKYASENTPNPYAFVRRNIARNNIHITTHRYIPLRKDKTEFWTFILFPKFVD